MIYRKEWEVDMKMIRLDKYMTMVQNLSRSEARQYIKKGRVSVDDAVAKKPELKIDPETAQVRMDGTLCSYEEFMYLMLYKPQGVVSATEDAIEKTVMDCVDSNGRSLFPVGRLDKDTEGLLLLTDDGKLAHHLLSPAHHVDKCYYAILDKEVGEAEEESFARGMDIGDEKKTLPAVLKPLGWKEAGYAVRITIREGRFHQIKRMVHAIGCEVLYLKRESMGSLCLDPALSPGTYRPLTKEEIRELAL